MSLSRGMRKTRLAEAQRAGEDIRRARRLLDQARRRLAHATGTDAPPVIVSKNLQALEDALTSRARSFESIPGVVGYTVGEVQKAGLPTGEPCLTVFVKRKLSEAQLSRRKTRRLPRFVTVDGWRIRVDVIQLGTLRRQVFVGASTGTAAPHARTAGTIGAFGTDNATGKRVAITAMHVSGVDEFPDGNLTVDFTVPSRFQKANARVLGTLVRGTSSRIDAAKIALKFQADAEDLIPVIGAIAGWRPTTIPGDNNAPVRMFGAESGLRSGVIIHPSAKLPEFGLDRAILVDIQTTAGDSGAALVDSSKHILGFLVGEMEGGEFANLRAFTPVPLVLQILRCDIP